MKTRYLLVALTLLALLAMAGGVRAASSQTISEPQDGGLMFVENVGQFDPQVRFQALGSGNALWVTDDGLWVTMVETQGGGEGGTQGVGDAGTQGGGVALKLSFAGATPQRVEPFELLETEMSYFLGDDPAKWVPGAPVWAGVRYVDLYPGIDLELSGVGGQLAPRLVVRDEAALGQVRMRVEGGAAVSAMGGQMVVETALGQVALPLLAVEGVTAAALPEVAAADGAFELAAPFAAPEVVLADEVGPLAEEGTAAVATTIIFSTYLGGNQTDYAASVVADSAKVTYVCGGTDSANFPTKTGNYDTTQNGSRDAFVSKYDLTGKLTASTFFGGAAHDNCNSLVLSGSKVYFTGYTESSALPMPAGAFDASYNGGGDAYAAILATTLKALVASTYLGGAGEDVGYAIDVDSNNNVYVVGHSEGGFPTTAGTAQPVFGGGRDAFVAKMNNALSARTWATYLGGGNNDTGGGVDERSGGVYVAGDTESNNFPKTAGAFDQTHNGARDGFITKLNGNGGLSYSTFVGSTSDDWLTDVAVDSAGRAHAVGNTTSANYPKTANALQPNLGGGQDAVLTVLNAAGNALVYSTFYGGANTDGAEGVALDSTPNSYIGGYTDSNNLPTKDPYQAAKSGNRDAFLSKVASTGGGVLLYGTYLGGTGWDAAYETHVDASGYILLVGATQSNNFPRVNAADNSFNGVQDAFVTKLALAPLKTTSFQDGVLPTTAYAGTRDTYVSQNSAAVNFGAVATLNVDGDDPNGSGKDICTLIKWDVTTIPSCATLSSASIVINVTNHSTGQVYELYKVTQNWDEMTATWNNQPTHDTKVLGTVGMNALGLYTINLNTTGKSVVQGWIDKPATNYGFWICDPNNTDGFDFDSSEAATAANRPKLTVQWVHPAVTTSAPADEPLTDEGAPEAGWPLLWMPLVNR